MQSSQELVLMIMQPENVKLLIEAVLGQLFMSWFIDDLKPFNPVTLLRLRVCDCLLGLLCRLPPTSLSWLSPLPPGWVSLCSTGVSGPYICVFIRANSVAPTV